MADIKNITIDGTTYDLKDAKAREDVSDLKEDIKDNYAKNDGYYENFGAGTAEQLVSTIFEEDSTPYNFRTSGGSIDIGDRLYDEIVGGTVAWNQGISTQTSSTTVNGITFSSDGSGIWTGSGTATADAYTRITAVTFTKTNHVYYIVANSTDSNLKAWMYGNYNTTNTATARIFKANGEQAIGLVVLNGATLTNTKITPQIFDLTQMFGSTIADYIYSLEQATAGAGVAWFKKLFPKPYYAYNAGELMSVQASSHDMVGFNAWDEEREAGGIGTGDGQNTSTAGYYRTKNYIPIIANATYYVKSPISLNVFFYDADKAYIRWANVQNDTVTMPENARFMRFRNATANEWNTYNNDICINLSWDGERDGEYEEYVKHSYALDSDLVLRGIPKLDASNNLYYDGDTYESDGTVTRKYGIVDLGTLTWYKFPTDNNENCWLSDTISGADVAGTGIIPNIMTTKYTTVLASPSQDVLVGYGNNVISTNTVNRIFVWDTANYSTATELRNALSGVYLIYKKTPTTEEAEPFTNPQIVDDFGTEEYVTTSIVPVGHNTKYQPNLRAKLEMAPNSPDGNGEYIVTQANGENSYTPLASSDVIQGLIARIEALEGAEGGGE